ncbi:MAG TPA: hypothetical protein VGG41_04485 [Solirubrobacteraceae bacterium]
MHDGITRVLSATLIVLGILLVLRGSGAILAIVLGIGMVFAGAGRLWVTAQQRRPPR